jgi:hypothetical protein
MIGTTLRQTSKLIAKRATGTSLSPLSHAFYKAAASCNTIPINNNTAAIQALLQYRQFSIQPTQPNSTPTKPLYNLPPSVIEQIKLDLQSVDFDKNGKIDADELRELLKKHNTSFTDEEIVELSELFYASRGAGAVPMEEFLAALDNAARKDGEKGLMGKEFKTHPLGIGTCASEYM